MFQKHWLENFVEIHRQRFEFAKLTREQNVVGVGNENEIQKKAGKVVTVLSVELRCSQKNLTVEYIHPLTGESDLTFVYSFDIVL